MSKVTMFEPVAWITNESLYGLKAGRTNSKGAVPVHASRSYVAKTPLVTITQAEAYKDACVREALEEALGIVELARESIGAGALAENAQYERSIVEPHLDGIDDEIRALIPPHQ